MISLDPVALIMKSAHVGSLTLKKDVQVGACSLGARGTSRAIIVRVCVCVCDFLFQECLYVKISCY